MNYILQKEILTFEEACIYLGRSASSMYKLTSARLIPHYVPTGKLIYFKRTELDE
ncbi:helix-turn-helix domain-containing protein [Ilyomonas limi]|uniref:Helix-turn-helix domain-containing protein n=1 Tax=Ilyomonas limi TaxID=2575867 RepID=A0A4U3L848_9BACT|nr:helix-turn-helix domain-containing protein [Ilyomonas limi]TKK71451.1 helix-turn-helix domain-containing protein [Ilyomonas limi]